MLSFFNKKRTVYCKICGHATEVKFSLPRTKLTGHAIPEGECDTPYYECKNCHFLFSNYLNVADNSKMYDEKYWETQDPDWNGRVNETLRLILFGLQFLHLQPWDAQILDFGCGMGCSLDTGIKLGFQISGTDLIIPKFGKEYYLSKIDDKQFDIIVACEVIEHLQHPIDVLKNIHKSLKVDGVFVYQTAYYDPHCCGKDWWYLGPANGHISLYSIEAFSELANKTHFGQLGTWNNYPGIQCWRKLC